MDKIINIAIDGPAGAGKSTIAKALARRLNILYVDTGAMYRAVGYYVKSRGVSPEDEAAVSDLMEEMEISLAYEDGSQVVYINGKNVNPYLRTEEAGMTASVVSAYQKVRKKLVAAQQAVANGLSLVMDGRDIGTCVLPKAKVKIYLDASVGIRAMRRYRELLERGDNPSLQEITSEIAQRDYQDMHRKISPLKKAADAVTVDTSILTIEEVTEKLLAIVAEKTGITPEA